MGTTQPVVTRKGSTTAQKLIAQARENSTNAVSIFNPTSSVTAIIQTIIIANTSGASATLRMFIDNDGTTFDETTAIAWDVQIDGGTVLQFDGEYIMNDGSGANFGYRSSVANALTITLFGMEVV